STFAHVYLLVSAKNGKTAMPTLCAQPLQLARLKKRARPETTMMCLLNAI
ncbi:MAG: hypothetical protein FD148_2872, partial [Methylocystaceae bacterium]